MSHNCNNCCPANCGPCYLNTNIVLKDLSSCQGIFTFGPDSLTIPGPCGLTGANTQVCPLDVNVLENCKGDYKITVLDDNGCTLNCIVLRCSQYELVPLEDLPEAVIALYEANLPNGFSVERSQVVQINANNLNLVGEYVSLEETAYFHRQVTQSYLNLWCGAEANNMVCQILANVDAAVAALENADEPVLAQSVYVLGQDLLKARVLALKQLCECGKVCNDQFFPRKTGPCQALRGCCPKRHY